MMNWDDLRFLLAVARAGSMSGAARELRVNHATVIRRIRSLEQQLGAPLFDRIGHSYQITPAGQVAFDAAERMEAQSVGVERQVIGQATDLSGTIRVTAPEPMCGPFLIPAIREFTAMYPDILIELSLSMRPYDLGMREADVAFRVTSEPPEDVVGTRLANLTLAVYGPAGAGLKAADVDRVVVIASPGDPDSGWYEPYVGDARVTLVTDTPAAAVEAIKGGFGVCRLPVAMGHADPGLERLEDIPYCEGQDMWLLTHVDVRTNARMRVFRDFMQEFFARRRHMVEVPPEHKVA
jgi:DNA-binding transcriptional LysR family regulator